MRARWKKEEGARGIYQIVVTEIPYQVQKAKLIERIAELIEQKKLPLLDDVRDESAEDIRIVLMPKSRTVEPEMLMEQLFRQTDLETRISLNMNVLDSGLIPRVMSLKRGAAGLPRSPPRRAGAPLARTGWRRSPRGWKCWKAISIVYLNLDKVIKIIRTEDEPKPKLMKAFKLTDTSGRSHPQHAAARPCASSRKWKSAREHDDSDQGTEGTEEAARFREAASPRS